MNITKRIICASLFLIAFCLMPAMAKKAPKDKEGDSSKTTAAAQVKKSETTAPVSADTVLVKVDDKTVTQGDLDSEINQIRLMMKNRGGSAQQFDAMLKNIKPQILAGLVVRKLIASECAREKITVTPKEIAREVTSFEATLPKKISLDDFLKQNGITRKNFERDVGEQVKIEKLLKIIPSTDKEIKAYYDENKKNYEIPETVNARHILIAVDAADDKGKKKDKMKKAKDLLKQLDKGEDFAKLAKENSDCPSKAKGGSLGEFPRGNMVPAFEKAAFSLKSNEVSKVVETKFGYHIIQNIGHNPPRTISYDDVKGQIAFRLKSRKVQKKLESLVDKLKAKAKIEYTKEGEAFKPLARSPMGGFPMMPADGKKGPAKSDK